ncbi:two-component system sensor histidine kinase VanS [Microbacterium terrae]|uniref:histidine kinase n=1 Tax=Microbacterium terrae TaxID=69369 RepID=A0A0M2H235_9MICO|nr:HAMP domain-containing sensor histidine kinase [Microbacterium terrae]KJL40477.1 Sensor kinase CusS [Microbacterium terrae]MBP1079198.1 two-component system sensor histidine kinase VanS [Microbacterium terrae]GLJ98598.1 two-component sensor histidine kinase [Microbacterium terrae]
MTREPGISVRLRLTISYAVFLMAAGGLLLAVVWVFLLRYVPAGPINVDGPFVPNRGDLVRAFAPAVAWALAFLLVVGVAGGWFLAGRMLAPLTRITHAVRQTASGSLSHRIRLEGPDDEFRELADSFDIMLGRLEAQVAEQRRFAANASHELRTPLAITQALLDVARSDPDRDVDDLIERLRSVNTRAIDLTEALLVLSRADQGAFAREEVDLSLVAEQSAETLLPLAERLGITIEVAGEPASAIGSPALLLQMATNLIHNAIVHNAGDGGFVRVTTSAVAGAAIILIENSGEKMSPALVSSLTEPFQRGTERIRGDDAGVGLGLAIVQSIVRAHGGMLLLEARAEGGLRAEVRLPRGSGA